MTYFTLDTFLLSTSVLRWQMPFINCASIRKQNWDLLLRTKFFLNLVAIEIVVLLLVLTRHLVGKGAFHTL